MTWMRQNTPGDMTGSRPVVVPRPRNVDALGEALATAFERRSPMPAEWEASLRALERAG